MTDIISTRYTIFYPANRFYLTGLDGATLAPVNELTASDRSIDCPDSDI